MLRTDARCMIVPRHESYRDGMYDQELRARRGRTGSHVRFERHSILYVAASVFFLLRSMSARISSIGLSTGIGLESPEIRSLETLNLLGIFTSIFLFWWAHSQKGWLGSIGFCP